MQIDNFIPWLGDNELNNAFAWQVIEALGEGVTVVNAAGRYEYVNPAYAKITGRSVASLIGQSPLTLTHPDDREILRQARARRRAGETTTYELRLVQADGRPVHVQITGVPRRQEGKVVGSFAIVTDITARKEAEEAYQTLVENSLQGLLIFQDFRVVFANRRIEEMSGYARDELTSMSPSEIMDMVYPDDREMVETRLAAHLAGEDVPARMEFRYFHREGDVRWMEVYTTHITYQGQPAAQVTYLDVTERKEAEQGLRESEARYRLLAEHATDMISVHDLDGIYRYVSPACRSLLGYEPGELRGRSAYDLFHPDDLAAVQQSHRIVLTLPETYTVTYRIQRKDGPYIWFETTNKTILNPETGEAEEIIALSRDVSERKEMADRLRQEKAFTEAVLDSLPGVFYLLDENGRLRGWNQNLEEVTGYTTLEIANMAPLDLVVEADQATAQAKINEAFLGKQFLTEIRYKRKDGQTLPYLCSGRRITLDEAPYLTGVGIDIRDRLQTEQELRASEQKYRAVVENVQDVIFQIDENGRCQFVNPAWTDLTGFSAVETIGRPYTVFVHPEDRDRVGEIVLQLIVGEREDGRFRARCLTKQGDFLWLEARVRAFHDEAGILGVLRDVTVQRRRERELESFVSVSQALRAANTRSEILPIVLEQAMALLEAKGALFVSYSSPGNKIVEFAQGDWKGLDQMELPATVGMNGFNLEQEQIYVSADIRASFSLNPNLESAVAPHFAVMGIPLQDHGDKTGMLWLGRKTPFQPSEANAFTAIGEIATITLERAHLLESMEQRVQARTQELAAANARLRELDQLKSKFIDDISHELRTPVTNLALYLDLIERGRAERREYYLTVLRKQTTRLGYMVESILAFAHLESAVAEGKWQPLNLNDVLTPLVEEYEPQAAAIALDFRYHPAAALPPVSGISPLLSQAIDYVLDNALKYTLSGAIEVSTYDDEAEEWVVAQIKDSGIGIAPDELEHVFDRFYRGEQISQLNTPGAGLGLSLAQQVASHHGGKVELESTLGKGTVVRLRLPVAANSATANQSSHKEALHE